MRADLALVGFGHVGRRFAELIAERSAALSADEDLTCRIVGISTGGHGALWCGDGIDVASAIDVVQRGDALTPTERGEQAARNSFDVIERLGSSDAGLRVVVETTTLDIEAAQPAIAHVRAAFAAGCDLVTANKGPAAFAYAALKQESDARGLSFLFEGAVMDGVPVFNLVRETLPAIAVSGFRGVVNSTTNHILSALEDGEAFAPALARMQAAGIAEADPSLDVDGWDAAAKTAALANVLMDAGITPHAVVRSGIGEWCAEASRAAIAKGRRLRLVASATRTDAGAVATRVAPEELPGTDLLAGLRGQANALIIRTDLLGDIAVCQLDGSLTQTAYALLSDLVTIRRRARPGAPAHRSR